MADIDHDDFAIEDITLTDVCQIHQWHAHNYDHWTTVLSGKGAVEIDGEEPKELSVGDKVLVPKGKVHKVKALEVPFRFQCEFVHRDMEGNPIPTYIGNDDAYV